MKVWLDTDIGSEIDDALALAYLLSNSPIELVGISTVTEGATRRAQLANALCRAAGQSQVTIHSGSERSLTGRPLCQSGPEANLLPSFNNQTTFESVDVAMTIRQAILQNVGEIVLLTIGPLSNIARLFQLDPQTPRYLKRLVTMCGNFEAGNDLIEWNVGLDPEAARDVFETSIPGGHYVIGLEATRALSMSSGILASCAHSAVLDVVLKLHEASGSIERPLTMYDLAASVLAIKPELCVSERGVGTIGLIRNRVITRWQRNPAGRHIRYRSISAEKITHEFLSHIQTHSGAGQCESASLA